jgi:hypothetical protein
MKRVVLVAATFAVLATPALACSPAPSCWMKSGTEYLRSVCKSYKGQSLKQIAEFVEEPEKIEAFGRACKKFGVHFRER